MDERKTIYLDDALEAIRKLPNAGIHWLVSAEAVFDALLKLLSAQSEPCEDAVSRIDDVIADQAYILDCLMALRNIHRTGNCNECDSQTCEYIPDPGQQVRYNCPLFKRKEEAE